MSSSSSTSLRPIIDASADQERPKPTLQRRSSASSIGSTRSRRSSSSSSRRPKIVVSHNRRILILVLRYLISQKEYAFLRKKVLIKAPVSIASNTPTRAEFDAVVKAATWDDFLPASSRAGLRMLLLCNFLLNGFEYAAGRLRSRKEKSVYVVPPVVERSFVRTNACILATSIIVLLRSLDPRCSITRISCRPCRWRRSLLPIACCIASFTSLDLICSCPRLRRLGRNTPMHRGFFSPRRHRPLRLRWRGLH